MLTSEKRGAGGALKIARARTSRAQSPKSLTAGFRGPPKGFVSSPVFDALSCYLSLIFKHSDTKWGYKKTKKHR